MKYYLLSFNDYNWEHNVPALACFTEERYNKWLLKETTKTNSNYEDQVKSLEKNKEEIDKFMREVMVRGLDFSNMNNWSYQDKAWYHQNVVYPLTEVPVKSFSTLKAYLGNNSDYFGEDYTDFLTYQDFVNCGVVKVSEVTEEFFETFNKNNLSNLSLCNIFEL